MSEKYLREDGEKEVAVRKVVYRSRKHLPQIKADLDLLEKLPAQATYPHNKTK